MLPAVRPNKTTVGNSLCRAQTYVVARMTVPYLRKNKEDFTNKDATRRGWMRTTGTGTGTVAAKVSLLMKHSGRQRISASVGGNIVGALLAVRIARVAFC